MKKKITRSNLTYLPPPPQNDITHHIHVYQCFVWVSLLSQGGIGHIGILVLTGVHMHDIEIQLYSSWGFLLPTSVQEYQIYYNLTKKNK